MVLRIAWPFPPTETFTEASQLQEVVLSDTQDAVAGISAVKSFALVLTVISCEEASPLKTRAGGLMDSVMLLVAVGSSSPVQERKAKDRKTEVNIVSNLFITMIC